MSMHMVTARAIAARTEFTVQERRQIMEMLGLVAEGGREVLPDVTRTNMHPSGMNRQNRHAQKNPDDLRVPSRHAAPPAGLRASSCAAGDTPRGRSRRHG
jgi:hypothetical protein